MSVLILGFLNLCVKAISAVLPAYGFIIVGCFLALINLPVFGIVISHRSLWKNYMILSLIFLHNGLTGFTSVIYGVNALTYDPAVDERYDSNKECLCNSVILLILLNTLNGVGLLVNSMERFIAIAFPIYYYQKEDIVLCRLILIEYAISIFPLLIAIVITILQPEYNVSYLCLEHQIFARGPYTFILLTRVCSAAVSILIMVAVVIIMKRYTEKLIERGGVQRDLKNFIENQERYTSTAMASCIITFFLFVLPSTIQAVVGIAGHPESSTISDFAIFLSYLNAFNMVAIFIYRQADARTVFTNTWRTLLCRRTYNVKTIVTTVSTPQQSSLHLHRLYALPRKSVAF